MSSCKQESRNIAQPEHSCFEMPKILLLNLQMIWWISVSTLFNDTQVITPSAKPFVCFLEGTSSSSLLRGPWIYPFHQRPHALLLLPVLQGEHRAAQIGHFCSTSKGAAVKSFSSHHHSTYWDLISSKFTDILLNRKQRTKLRWNPTADIWDTRYGTALNMRLALLDRFLIS